LSGIDNGNNAAYRHSSPLFNFQQLQLAVRFGRNNDLRCLKITIAVGLVALLASRQHNNAEKKHESDYI